MIAALEKAEALARHRAYLGVHPEGWSVSLTHAEAVELLDWFLANADYPITFQDELRRMRAEPFRAFEATKTLLVGFSICPLQ